MLDIQAIIEPKLSIVLSFKNKLGSNVLDYACTVNACDSQELCIASFWKSGD